MQLLLMDSFPGKCSRPCKQQDTLSTSVLLAFAATAVIPKFHQNECFLGISQTLKLKNWFTLNRYCLKSLLISTVTDSLATRQHGRFAVFVIQLLSPSSFLLATPHVTIKTRGFSREKALLTASLFVFENDIVTVACQHCRSASSNCELPHGLSGLKMQ